MKSNVFNDHFVYSKNKSQKSVLKKIQFPSVETQKHAIRIFEFIDAVRRTDTDNGFFEFDLASDIVEKLRKQWAGMFFDFLRQRSTSQEAAKTNTMLENISTVSEKVEELVKRLYLHVDRAGAPKSIEEVDHLVVARAFGSSLALRVPPKALTCVDIKVEPYRFDSWLAYIERASKNVEYSQSSSRHVVIGWKDGSTSTINTSELDREFNSFKHALKNLSKKQRWDLLKEFLHFRDRTLR